MTKIITRITRLMAATVMCSLLATTGHAETMRFGVITTPDHSWSRLMQDFKQRVETTTNNDMRVRESRFAKVRGESSIIELMSKDRLQAAIVAVGSLTTLDPSLNGWLVPYQFKTLDSMRAAATNTQAVAMRDGLEQHNMVVLGYVFPGMRVILTAEPLTAAELKGKRIGTFPNDVFYNWYRQLGADPQPIHLQDIREGFVKGSIDAVDIDLASTLDLELHQQANHLMLTRHMAFPGVFVVSKSWWESLSETNRQSIRQSFIAAEAATAKGLASREKNTLKELANKGMKITEYTEADFNGVPKKLRDFYYGTNTRLREFGLASE